MAHYESVNNVARRVIKRYEPISNVARSISKGYESVNNVARQFFSKSKLGLFFHNADFITSNGGTITSECNSDAATVTIVKAKSYERQDDGSNDFNAIFYFNVNPGDYVTVSYTQTRSDGTGNWYADVLFGTTEGLGIASNMGVHQFGFNSSSDSKSFAVPAGHYYCNIAASIQGPSSAATYSLTITQVTVNGTRIFPEA